MLILRKAVRVLGVDCGLAIVGWEVLERSGNNYKHIDGGVIETPKGLDTYLRLKLIYENLCEVIQKYRPESMAVEELFFFKNHKTIITVGEARGVILLAGSINNIKVFGYTPLEVKIAVTGYGRADKKQIQFMVKKLLNLKEQPKQDDWADAIAVAICHVNTNLQ